MMILVCDEAQELDKTPVDSRKRSNRLLCRQLQGGFMAMYSWAQWGLPLAVVSLCFAADAVSETADVAEQKPDQMGPRAAWLTN